MSIIDRRIPGPLNQFPVSGTLELTDPSYISVTQTNNVTTLGDIEDETDDYYIFKTTIDTGATSTTFNTDAESSDMSFAAATGRFTATVAGVYRIGVSLSLRASASTAFYLYIKKDSTTIHTQYIYVPGDHDPVNFGMNIIETLAADNYIRVYINRSTDDNIYPNMGSTVTMERIDASGGGGGGSLTINNNTEGNILMATGGANEISGISVFKYDDDNNVVSGSGQIKAQSFAFEGTNDGGTPVLYNLSVKGGILQLVSGSL